MSVEAPTSGEPLQLGGDGAGRGRQGSLGCTRVANEVVAWIAALTALEVPGVSAMYRPAGQQIGRILRRPVAHRGVKVRLLDDNTLLLDLYIVMDAGTNLPESGAAVQRRVHDAIDRMLGMGIAEINVFVSEVVFR